MQELVEHYSAKGWLQRVEQCVLHMDISSLDFNQVVRLCREHGLYSTLVYLFNKGLNDYRAPLEELFEVLQNSQKDSAVALGYRMLVYLKYCFIGLAFAPGRGTIPPKIKPLLYNKHDFKFTVLINVHRNHPGVEAFLQNSSGRSSLLVY
ncbi:hypothetical protein HN51_059482 [Arachis hypogaea]|nr:vacuolar protein sorting-associated protein 8 homolog isoform X2 [Arachis ipaensis]XP_025682674.1 vacuolar protein sorting-associated protein 8 homolog [Arachis hypogaea]